MGGQLKDKVVVITGASSGIGKAAALGFAGGGAAVVAMARRQKALQTLVRECENLGGRAMAIPRDVADEAGVRDAAEMALDAFGRIDVWVNNAAVTCFGRFEETPYDVLRRVIEVNLMGYIHGARAALPIFRQQGSGVLINVSSVVGKIAQPYTSAYCVTKFGINGLSQSLRMELMDAPDIHVCTVTVPSVDTPLFQNAANYTGRAVKPMEPVHEAEKVAALIVELALKPRPEATLGAAAAMVQTMRKMAGPMAEKAMARKVERDHFQDRPAENTQGNLFEPGEAWTSVSGGWRVPRTAPSHAGRNALVALVAAAGAGAGAMSLRKLIAGRH